MQCSNLLPPSPSIKELQIIKVVSWCEMLMLAKPSNSGAYACVHIFYVFSTVLQAGLLKEMHKRGVATSQTV